MARRHDGSTQQTSAQSLPTAFVRTFRVPAEEVATFPHAVVEEAMGHAVGGKVEHACRRTDLLGKRRDLMEAYAQFCEGGANVVAFKRPA